VGGVIGVCDYIIELANRVDLVLGGICRNLLKVLTAELKGVMKGGKVAVWNRSVVIFQLNDTIQLTTGRTHSAHTFQHLISLSTLLKTLKSTTKKPPRITLSSFYCHY